MPYIIRATYLRYVLPFLFGVLAAAEDLPSLGDFVKARFVADNSSEMTNYRVCELFSKSDDKRAFFRNAFGVDVCSGAQSIESREVLVEDEVTLRRLHLGILALHFDAESTAYGVHEKLTKQGGFFKSTKILTKFIPVLLGKSVVVIYSETAWTSRYNLFSILFLGSFGRRQK
jgi:hypothetical protein